MSVEGAVTYKALLFVPAAAPYDFYTKDYQEKYNVIMPGYDMQRPRILKGTTDYNTLKQ